MIIDCVKSAKKYMERYYFNIGNVETISKKIGCNYHSIRAEFVRKYGMTMNNYLNFARCQNAKRYLRNTDWKLYSIASEVGFKNEKYFIKVFKKYFSIPPETYRREIK